MIAMISRSAMLALSSQVIFTEGLRMQGKYDYREDEDNYSQIKVDNYSKIKKQREIIKHDKELNHTHPSNHMNCSICLERCRKDLKKRKQRISNFEQKEGMRDAVNIVQAHWAKKLKKQAKDLPESSEEEIDEKFGSALRKMHAQRGHGKNFLKWVKKMLKVLREKPGLVKTFQKAMITRGGHKVEKKMVEQHMQAWIKHLEKNNS